MHIELHIDTLEACIDGEPCEIAELLKRFGRSHVGGDLHPYIIFQRRSCTMAVLPVSTLLDNEELPVGITPRKSDGKIDTNAVPVWSTSDSSGLPVEPQPGFDFDDGANGTVACPAGFKAVIKTPNVSGKGNVTCKVPGYEDAVFPIAYSPGSPKSLNASIGSPTLD